MWAAWQAIETDPYAQIAGLMRFEGYTEFDIELEIAAMKKANGDD